MAKEINLKEVAKIILEKNPYRVIKDDSDKTTPATEKSWSVDALAFHISKVGDSFQNIPYGKQSTNWGVEKKHVAFIGENGEILEEMKCAPYFLVKESDDLKKYRRDFKFSSDENKLVFALKLTEDHPKSGISNFLLFLSKPMSFKTIQELRHSVYNKEDTGRVNRDLESIELIWK